MYSYPTLFPQSSNREDLTRTISLFDDDTGQPINLTGITFLQNPNGFTGHNWQVTDGQIVTTSATQFTVPGYPVGNQLSALNIIVGLNLGILGGDPITITDVNGNATMIGYVLSYAAATGALSVQIGVSLTMEIRSQDQYYGNSDYSQWYDWGGGIPNSSQPIILAQLGTYLTIIDIGYIQINIPAIIMQQLRSRTYLLSMIMSDSVNTRQIFISKLPILYGGISTLTNPGVVTNPALSQV